MNTFLEVLRFELTEQLRSRSFYFYVLVCFGLSFGSINLLAGAFSDVQVAIEKVNSPYAVLVGLTALSAIALLVAAGIFSQSVCKDFEAKTADMIFSLPIQPRSLFIGRWVAATIATIWILLSLGTGYAIGEHMPWLDRENLLPFNSAGYIYVYCYFILPNLLIFSGFYFSVGLMTRRTLLVYLTGVILFIGGGILSHIFNQWTAVATSVDATGATALAHITQFWTSTQRETQLPPLTIEFLINRVLWISLSVGFISWTLYTFSIAPKFSRSTKLMGRSPQVKDLQLSLVPVHQSFDPLLQWRYVASQSWVEFQSIAGNRWFIVGLLLATLPPLLIAGSSVGLVYQTPLYPLTHLLVDQSGGLYTQLFKLLLIFLAGDMIWRDRSAQIHQLTDVLPIRNFVPLLSKYVALALIILSTLGMVMVSCLLVQTLAGFTQYEFSVYFILLFTKALPELLILAALSFFIQVAIQNLYLGYLITALLLFIVPQTAAFLKFPNILIYGNTPAAPYSQFDGFGTALTPLRAFQGYWSSWAVLLLSIAFLLWQRGEDKTWRSRLKVAIHRWNRSLRYFLIAILTTMMVMGGWIYYNTRILNPIVSERQVEISRVNYEQMFQKIGTAQPQVQDIQLRYELYPQQRRLQATGRYELQNQTKQPIQQVLINLNLDNAAQINRMALGSITQPSMNQILYISPDLPVAVRAFRLPQPLLPGEITTLDFELTWQPKRGFSEFQQSYGLTTNGTSLDGILPTISYELEAELTEPEQRSHYGLSPRPQLKTLADQLQLGDRLPPQPLVTWTVTVGTSKEQTAVVPGLLQREWREGDRHYFEYRMKQPVMFKMPLYSARYEVRRQQWQNLPIEIYYLKGHEFNVNRLIRATQASLEYYTQNFSPTPFGQVRIFELPREQYAVSLPGTIGFAEYIGFLAKVDQRNPNSIDYPSYVTAHEVAHQWWGHQLVPNLRLIGARTMNEMLSQYSALMVMEKLYGEHTIHKILEHELEGYFLERSSTPEEQPLVSSDADHVVYRKGAVAMYALKQTLGEDTLNQALAQYLQEHSITSPSAPPLPTILDLLQAIKDVTPSDRRFLISDWLENMIIYDAQAIQATAVKRSNGRYEVTFTASLQKFQTDKKGNETPIDLNPQETVEIGILGENDQWLYRQSHHLTSGENTIAIAVTQLPKQIGIDLSHHLLNRSFKNIRVTPLIVPEQIRT
jgi:ABC-type transport system involved in multi-copper enzyme maturation permease subunit